MELAPNVLDWNVPMVCEWLSRINLRHLSATFQDNEVDGNTLLQLTPEDLREELQIKNLGDRKKVKEGIEKLHFTMQFVDQAISLNLMMADARNYSDKNEVYESQDDSIVAIREQIQEYNQMEDVLQNGKVAFEYANTELKIEADSDEAQQLQEQFHVLSDQEFEDHNIARRQGGLPPVPRGDSPGPSSFRPSSASSSSSAASFSLASASNLSSSVSSASSSPSISPRSSKQVARSEPMKSITSALLSLKITPFAGPSSKVTVEVPKTKPLKNEEIAHMQQKNQESKESQLPKGTCITCADERVSVFELACEHTICPKCLAELFEHAIRDHSLMPPKCCQVEIDANLAFELLDHQRALEFAQHHMEATAINKMYCPNATCSQFINLDLLEAELGYELDCPKCKTTICTKCQKPGHSEISCEEAKKKSGELDLAFLSLADSREWRKCGKCGRMIELSYGCNHMTCHCRHEFCFTCGADWKPNRACDCALFTEERLIQVVEERRPANQQEFYIANALRNRVECNSHRWNHVFHPQVRDCENCGYSLQFYGFECRGCSQIVCRTCAYHRMSGRVNGR